jgi:hypothetical protein
VHGFLSCVNKNIAKQALSCKKKTISEVYIP